MAEHTWCVLVFLVPFGWELTWQRVTMKLRNWRWRLLDLLSKPGQTLHIIFWSTVDFRIRTFSFFFYQRKYKSHRYLHSQSIATVRSTWKRQVVNHQKKGWKWAGGVVSWLSIGSAALHCIDKLHSYSNFRILWSKVIRASSLLTSFLKPKLLVFARLWSVCLLFFAVFVLDALAQTV